MITITREHEICCGHRVYKHEGKCKNIHGHGYKFELTLSALDSKLDELGRILDFSVVRNLLCEWLEKNWDHKLLLWNEDPLFGLLLISSTQGEYDGRSIVGLPCNPTAENIAKYFFEDIAPGLLLSTGVDLISVRVWETSKCSATYDKSNEYDWNSHTTGKG